MSPHRAVWTNMSRGTVRLSLLNITPCDTLSLFELRVELGWDFVGSGYLHLVIPNEPTVSLFCRGNLLRRGRI